MRAGKPTLLPPRLVAAIAPGGDAAIAIPALTPCESKLTCCLM